MTATSGPPQGASIVVVGGGLGGLLFALHLTRSRPDLLVRIVERSGRVGPGLAYGACTPVHLLNVPAARLDIGVAPSFEIWLQRFASHPAMQAALAESGGKIADAFAPRRLFGQYLEELAAGLPFSLVSVIRGEAVAFLDGPRRGVLLSDGRELEADVVVLAWGNLPPKSPDQARDRLEDARAFIPDPWAAGALAPIGPDDPVVLIGTGLTAVDVALALREQGHRAAIAAVSRRGLTPRRHAFGGQWRPFMASLLPASPLQLLRAVRLEMARAEAEGTPWQRVIDAIRPSIALVWRGWSSGQRRQFLRHLRPWWDVVRHRMAPRVADQLDGLIAAGDLRILAGRMLRHEPAGDGLQLTFRRADGSSFPALARWVINCTGPRSDLARIGAPLIHDARRRGLIQPDPLGLGIETDACAVLDAEGRRSDWLYAIGSLTRPAWWEITAAPEINAQVSELAASFAQRSGAAATLEERFQDLGAGI